MENKVFGYARVSTSHQSTDRQLDALIEYGVAERDIITDYQSGKDFNRQGYISLKENMLRKGDTLVVKELDRLGRDKRMIKEELEYFCVKIVLCSSLSRIGRVMDRELEQQLLDQSFAFIQKYFPEYKKNKRFAGKIGLYIKHVTRGNSKYIGRILGRVMKG